jgi:ABC-type uncharacterized transport system auxiliary subunit
MNNRSLIKKLAIAVYGYIALIVGGCAVNQVVPQDHFYRLPRSSAPLDQFPVLDVAVALQGFQSASIYTNRALVYTQVASPITLHRYHYHFWEDPLTKLVHRQLFSLLLTNDIFRHCSELKANMAYDYKIGGRIYAFDHILDPGMNRVKVELGLWLQSKHARSYLINKIYTAEQSVGSSTIQDAVNVFGQLLSDIFVRFLADLNQVGIQDSELLQSN